MRYRVKIKMLMFNQIGYKYCDDSCMPDFIILFGFLPVTRNAVLNIRINEFFR